MISESRLWKEELLRIAGRLRKKKSQKVWRESSVVNVEKDIIVAFFIIRKLIESRKVTDKTAAMLITLPFYPSNNSKPTDFLNRHELDDLYFLNNAKNCKLSLREVCNQLIHSFIFSMYWKVAGRSLGGVFFGSDRKKNILIYSLSLSKIIEILEKIGNEYPDQMKATRDHDTDDWLIEMT